MKTFVTKPFYPQPTGEKKVISIEIAGKKIPKSQWPDWAKK